MLFNRPTVLSLAGFDPSGGAGIIADVKVFEQTHVYGLGVCTAITYQNDDEFKGVKWLSLDIILPQIKILFKKFEINFVKIGLIENLDILDKLLKKLFFFNPKIKIIWDPVMQSSTGFEFHKNIDKKKLKRILKKLFIVTPNTEEIKIFGENNDIIKTSSFISNYCKVYLKGGHSKKTLIEDILFENGHIVEKFLSKRIKNGKKHGSGCVLSAALVSNLAKGQSVSNACKNSKIYIQKFLKSNNSLLGYHAKTI